MNICIVGPGAIGLLYYFHLAKKVKDMTILDKDKNRAKRLSQKGLTMLKEGKKVPDKFSRPEILEILKKYYATNEI